MMKKGPDAFFTGLFVLLKHGYFFFYEKKKYPKRNLLYINQVF
jgi:hypothetical protein